MRTPVPGDAQWRKSSRSDTGENCVEVWRSDHAAALRDSKNTAGPMLALPPSALTALLDAVAE